MAGFFDDWDWGSILRPAVSALPQAIAAGYGARQVSNANSAAASIAQQNRNANIQAILDAAQRASGVLQPAADQQMPAIAYMRNVMARAPEELTPQQTIQLSDARRTAVDMTPASLRGSGRVVSAISNDVANRTKAGMIEQNRARSDRAAQTLGSTGGAATTSIANLTAGAGPAIVSQNTGAAEATGNAITGTAGSNAQTLGNIASFFANSVKDQERESRYKDLRDSMKTNPSFGNAYTLGTMAGR